MQKIAHGFWSLFMDKASHGYKAFLLGILLLNPVLLMTCGPFWTGWAVLVEFLLILSFSLECYPLFPGGLLALEVLFLKMTPLASVMKEIHANIDVIMLLMFMVPGIYFMKPLLAWIFMRLFAATKNKVVLSLVFLLTGAFLAAWLDALTVVAVMITVCAAAKDLHAHAGEETEQERQEFDGFLRNLLMHGAIGTGLGGVATLIGQPQNIIIGHYAGWSFQDFYVKMAHFSIPLQLLGLLVCWALEHFRMKIFGFGYQLPPRIGTAFEQKAREELSHETLAYRIKLLVMFMAFVCLMLALAFQIAPVGVIGLGIGTEDLGAVRLPENPEGQKAKKIIRICGRLVEVEARFILTREDFRQALGDCEIIFVTSHSRFGAGPVFRNDGKAFPFLMQKTKGYEIVMPDEEICGFAGKIKRRFYNRERGKFYTVFEPDSSDLDKALPLHGYQLLALSTCTSKKHFGDEIQNFRSPYPTTAIFTRRAACLALGLHGIHFRLLLVGQGEALNRHAGTAHLRAGRGRARGAPRRRRTMGSCNGA